MSDLFYVFGLALTALAVIVSFAGMRSENFPPSRGAFMGGLTVMVFLVVGSCAFAIVLSREEQEHRREEVAEFRAEEAEAEAAAAEEEGQAVETGEDDPAEQPGEEDPGPQVEPGEPLEVTSPATGDLVFDPTSLMAPAGEVIISYTNPSEVPHNVAIEIENEDPAQGETVTGGDAADTAAELEPGEYVYYCSIPGHRESGMEGILTVE